MSDTALISSPSRKTRVNDTFRVKKIEPSGGKPIQICNHCGRSVRWGSGWFVNRVPDFNDKETRIANHLAYPDGDYVCYECDCKTCDDF